MINFIRLADVRSFLVGVHLDRLLAHFGSSVDRKSWTGQLTRRCVGPTGFVVGVSLIAAGSLVGG